MLMYMDFFVKRIIFILTVRLLEETLNFFQNLLIRFLCVSVNNAQTQHFFMFYELPKSQLYHETGSQDTR